MKREVTENRRRGHGPRQDGADGGRPNFLSTLRLWLAPGMGVKRHVVLAVLGALLALVGTMVGVLWLLAEERAALTAPIEGVLVSRFWRQVGGWLALLGVIAGGVVAIDSIARLNRSLLSNWMPRPHEAAVVLHRRLALSRGPRIVAFGGGTGLSNLLRGLRRETSNLTAVVTVADDGGSSGRLRAAFGMPAPGDLSDCLAALSDHEVEVSRLMDYRFVRGGDLQGHTFGNLLITTLSEVEGDFGRAARVLNRLLNLSGSVWPVTDQPVTLRATKTDGQRVDGESQVRSVPGRVARLELEPPDARALPEVIDAVRHADLVVLGPGSLFTSVLAPLVLPDVRRALTQTSAPVVYVCNIMTEAGETDGLDAFEHVRAIHEHLGRWPDLVLVNDVLVDRSRLEAYRRESAEEVQVPVESFARHGVTVRTAPLLGDGPHAQHHPERLARELLDLATAARAGAVLS